MAEPSMTTVLENVEKELVPSEVRQFAPPKVRANMPGTSELAHISTSLRKSVAESLEHLRALQAYLDNTKTSLEMIQRSIGG